MEAAKGVTGILFDLCSGQKPLMHRRKRRKTKIYQLPLWKVAPNAGLKRVRKGAVANQRVGSG